MHGIWIYLADIKKDLPNCWWEICDLTSSTGDVCHYVGRESGTAVDIPLSEVRKRLDDETTGCPPTLSLQFCEFPDHKIVVRGPKR